MSGNARHRRDRAEDNSCRNMPDSSSSSGSLVRAKNPLSLPSVSLSMRPCVMAPFTAYSPLCATTPPHASRLLLGLLSECARASLVQEQSEIDKLVELLIQNTSTVINIFKECYEHDPSIARKDQAALTSVIGALLADEAIYDGAVAINPKKYESASGNKGGDGRGSTDSKISSAFISALLEDERTALLREAVEAQMTSKGATSATLVKGRTNLHAVLIDTVEKPAVKTRLAMLVPIRIELIHCSARMYPARVHTPRALACSRLVCVCSRSMPSSNGAKRSRRNGTTSLDEPSRVF